MGQRWVLQWGSNRHAMNGAAILLAWADLPEDMRSGPVSAQAARCVAMKQLHYVAGENDRGSYIAGWGDNPPLRAHHRNSAIAPWEQNDGMNERCVPAPPPPSCVVASRSADRHEATRRVPVHL